MSGSSRQDAARGEQPLVALMMEVNQARTYVVLGRARQTDSFQREDQHYRNRLLFSALEAYAEAASALGAPLPYQYRDQMRLLQLIYPGVAGNPAAARPDVDEPQPRTSK